MADSELPPAGPVPEPPLPHAPEPTPVLHRTHPLTVAVRTVRMLVSVVGFLLVVTVFGTGQGRALESIGFAGLVLLATIFVAAL